MAKAKGKKKGPPYDDDPGCKYVVIDDPWPGNATGKDRRPAFWDLLGAWVHHILDKKESPEVIYSVNTRAEVIVRLPEHVDIVPVLGAHVWREFLSDGDPRDVHRVSYFYEYNYRSKGDPGNHQWVEHYPSPPHLRFPVKFPYPAPHWASLHGRNCADLALALPKTRLRTPTPPPSLFTPYQPPAHFADGRAEVETTEQSQDHQEVETESNISSQAFLYVDKRDPYEEEDAALQFVKREPQDSSSILSVKQEPDVPVKAEIRVKSNNLRAPGAQNQPSAAFLAAFQRLEQSRGAQTGTNNPQSVTQQGTAPVSIQCEALDAPLQSVNAEMNTQSGGAKKADSPPNIRVKAEPQDGVLPPANFHPSSPIRRDPRIGQSALQTEKPQDHLIKQEPGDSSLDMHMALPRDGNPRGTHDRSTTLSESPSTHARNSRVQARESSLKRPKEEESDEFTKRIKREPEY